MKIQRTELRGRLLAGVAISALVSAPPSLAQEAKWQPWLEVGGAIGSDHSFGDVDMFIPVWQDQTSLLFGDLRGTFTTSPTQEGNFGLGYRTQVSPDWIVGAYGFIDIQNSENDNLFYQGSVGAELLSVDWDLRLNGYFPFNSGGKSTGSNNGHLEISGNTIGITTDREKPLYGFDGEVGWRLPIFPADGDMDVRAFIGGYFFTNSDVDTIAGPRGRLEVRLYDLDFLGVQSRLTINGEVQWDNPRGTQAFGGLELRIPLGAVTGTPGPKLSPLDRRMVDRVQRDVDIVTEDYQSDPSDVIVDGLTVKTHTIVFAEAGGTGNGTKGNPTSLENAPALAAAKGANAIIVVRGEAGPINLSGQPVQLEDGQALLGGDSRVRLTDADDSDIHVGFHAPGARPTVIGSTSSANLINMYAGGQNRVTGLDLAGTFANAIFGSNMERAIITDNFIDPPAGNGIFLQNSGAAIPVSQFAYIARNTIEGAASAGIAVHSYLFDATAHTQTVSILDNTVTGGGVGISETVNGSGQPGFVGSVLIAGNSIDGVSGHGIVAVNSLLSMTGGFTTAVTIYGNRVSNAGGNGIESIDSFAGVPGTALETQIIAGNEISGIGQDGIFGIFSAVSMGALSQTATIASNSVTSIAGAGIKMVLADGLIAGELDSALSVTGNGVTSAGGRGIDLFVNQFSAPAISQAVTISRNSIATVGSDGVSLSETLNLAGDVTSTVSIYGNSVSSAAANGIAIGLKLDAISGGVSGSMQIGRNIVGSAGGDGIGLVEIAQSIGGAATLALDVYGNRIASAGVDGIGIANSFAAILGGTSLALSIAGNSIRDLPGDGIALRQTAIGTSLAQSIAIYANSIAAAGQRAVAVSLYTTSAGSVSETVLVNRNQISGGGVGISVLDRVVDASSAVADLTIYGNTLTSAASLGSQIFALFLGSEVDEVSHQAAVNGNSFIDGPFVGPAVLLQDIFGGSSSTVTDVVMISGNSWNAATGGGIIFNAVDSVLDSLDQQVTIADNTVGSLGIISVQETENFISTAATTISITGNQLNDPSATAAIDLNLLNANLGSFSQTIDVTSNAFGHIGVSNRTLDDGSVAMNLSIDGNTATGDFAGIKLYLNTFRIGSLTQAVGLSGNVVDTASLNAIYIVNKLNTLGTAGLSMAIENNRIAAGALSGIYLTQAIDNGAALQTLAIDGNSITGGGKNGIADRLGVGGSGSFTQAGTIDGNVVSGAGADGILVSAGAGGGASLALSLAGNNVGGNGGNGFAGLANGVGTTETFTLVSGSGNHFTGNGGAGAYLSNNGGSLAFHINGNDLAGNTGGTTATAGTVVITP